MHMYYGAARFPSTTGFRHREHHRCYECAPGAAGWTELDEQDDQGGRRIDEVKYRDHPEQYG